MLTEQQPEEDEFKHRFYLSVLNQHNHWLFSNLLYEHHISSDNLKSIETETDTYKGYYAKKDRKKYLITEKTYNFLPIRIGDEVEELKVNDDIVLLPLKPTPFKIVPKHSMSVRILIDDFAPFQHSNPDTWTLAKIIAIQGYIAKTFVCIATEPHFGKSSLYDLLHYITDKSPVFKPRSVPGVLNQINGTGNLVFDETHRCKKEVRDIIEEFALQIAGGKETYINGALEARNTKQRYNCNNQSITFLYNETTQYNNPEKDYFEYIFSNNGAIDDRFLKLHLKGILTEEFKKTFNIEQTAENNRQYYINLAKELLYLQEHKKTGIQTRTYEVNTILNLKGRRKIVYQEITWLLDQYCESQTEMNKYVALLDQAILDYKEMINKLNTKTETVTFAEEEYV